MRQFSLTLFICLYCLIAHSQSVLEGIKYDSILRLRKLGTNSELNYDSRYNFAKEAVFLSKTIRVDSILLKSNRILSTICIESERYEEFRDINYDNLKLSNKLNDSLAIAIANQNLGWYYHYISIYNDSAYYYLSVSEKYFTPLKNKTGLVDIYLALADIHELEKDYLGSEEIAIRALELLETMPANEQNLAGKWILKNLLGIISQELKYYDQSIQYHEEAIEIAKRMKNGFSKILTSKNNIAFVYKQIGDFQTAINLYKEVRDSKGFFERDPSFYALANDNIAFTSFLAGEKDYDKLEKMFKRSYKIADSLDDPITKMAVTIDLSKFYYERKMIDSSFKYATENYQLSKETSTTDMLMEAMIMLSKLKEGQEGKQYLMDHIRLSDSLLDQERGVRNKFARVKFETDQIKQENERIATQRFWLLIASIVLLVTLFLLYVIITQRAKNKKLQFEKEQQLANEEIYNLMLMQQDKVDEARAQEKKRISEEMHDGILGRLFGTRLSLDTFNFKDGPEAAKTRSQYISDLKNIEQDIRKISHDLNTDFVAGSGFMDIVETLIKNQTTVYQLSYQFEHSDEIDWEQMPNKSKIHIYRILQETIQNIYKHAEAKNIKISFNLKNDVILLTIGDDGKGFVVNKSKKGIGLKNINSRVNEVGGTVRFESAPNKGTTIEIQIPNHSKIQ